MPPVSATRPRPPARRAARPTPASLPGLALLLGLAFAVPARAVDSPLLFRPLVAGARENLIHLRVCSFTQDMRYGTDVTDSTTEGGWDEDVSGVGFDVGAGKAFRAPVWERAFGWRGPWRRYQLSASALASSSFDRIRAQFLAVVDYQFGGAVEIQWTGEGDGERGVTSFARPVWTTRTGLYHRSAHVGEEYVALGNFGANQTGAEPGLSARPPVRGTVLSHEVVEHLTAIEWAPRGGAATLRAYAGGEVKAGISGLKPRRLRSPAVQLGLEWRAAGNRARLDSDPLSRWVNRTLRAPLLATSWFAAADLRLARPFNFASADNPSGETEVWTPGLWTNAPYGREFRRYAGTWHAMVGLSLSDPARRSARPAGAETLLTLDWYRGYSSYGPFLDSRRRTHPRWYVVPGLTMHF